MSGLGSAEAAHHYERHVDGLRGVAVIAVLLFHAGVPGFTGGFVGVDVFFVISGYLITGILRRELEQGKFSLWSFYERRARRILPALLTVLATTLVVGAIVLVPGELSALGRSALATLGFGSNFWFWRTIDYFAGEGQPLLHTWSLAVEEQFYLLLPPALWLLHRFRLVLPGILFLLLASLALSASLTAHFPAASFYLLPTRGWELLIGSTLSHLRRDAPGWFGWMGLGIIALSIAFFDAQTPFPGIAAAVPALGAAAIISARRGGPAPLLSAKAFVGVGLISYSLYLWHWPALFFAREAGYYSLKWSFAALGAASGLSILTWRYVEQPVRNRARFPLRRLARILVPATVGAALLSCATIGGLPDRYSLREQQLAFAANDRPWTSLQCEVRPCDLGTAPPRWELRGDSHAAAYGEAVAMTLGNSGRITTMNACPPVIGYAPRSLKGEDVANCLRLNLELESTTASHLILAGYWNTYLSDERFLPALRTSLSKLRTSGKQVTVLVGLGPAPFSLPDGLAQQLRWRGSYDATFKRRILPLSFFEALAVPNVRVIDLGDTICRQAVCPTTVKGSPVFFDSHHISATAGRYLIAPILGGKQQHSERVSLDAR